MNSRILLAAIFVTALSSCSVYRSGQTPDDVYYSPAPAPQVARHQKTDDSYVDVNQHKEGTNNSNYQSYDQYQDGVRDDRFLRMSIDNPYYMNSYNSYGNFDWRYNSYYDGFNYGYSSPWNNYFAWNSFYNPYYGIGYGSGIYLGYGGGYGGGYYVGGGVKSITYTTPIRRPIAFNVNSYTNANRPPSRNYVSGNNYNNSNARYNNGNGNRSATTNTYYNNNNNNGRSSYTPSNSNNSNNNSTSTPSRSYSPSSSGGGGGGSSSSSGGGGGGGRPGRGN